VGKTSHFLALNVNILKMVIDTPKLLLFVNRKSHMCFRLTPISMTLDDLEVLYICVCVCFSAVVRHVLQCFAEPCSSSSSSDSAAAAAAGDGSGVHLSPVSYHQLSAVL